MNYVFLCTYLYVTSGSMETSYSSSSQVGEDDVFDMESKLVLVWSFLLPKAHSNVNFVLFY